MKPSLFLLGALAIPGAAHAQNRVISTDTTNIAAAQNGGRVLSVTSTLSNDKGYASSNLIDGQNFNAKTGTGSKGWASNKFDPINMDSVTLGFAGNSSHKIGKITLNPGTDLTPERWAKDVEIQVSTDTAEGPFQSVAQLTLKREATPQEFPLLPVEARFVKLVFRSNWGSDRAVGLGEVEIYEAIDNSDALGSLIGRLESTIAELKRYREVQVEGGQTIATPATVSRRTAAPTGAKFQQIQLADGNTGAFPTANLNIAALKNGGKIVASSPYYNNDPSYGPNKLLDGENFREADGKGSFGFASEGFEPGKPYVTIGFANDRTRLLGRVTLNPASNQSDLRYARRVQMEVTSGDQKTGPWKLAATLNLTPRAVNQDFTFRPVEAKYVRFTFLANGPGVTLPNADPNVNSDRSVSLGEIEIYEAVAGNDQLEALIGKFNGVLADFKTLRRQQINGTAPTEAIGTPAILRRGATPKAVQVSTKTAPKNAKKNVQEAALSGRQRNG